MDIITYIILGIIQGITEPIPVSSSGHIFLFKNIFNTNIFNTLNFEIISNFGSFIAIFIIFWKDIKELIVAFFSYIFKKDTRKKYKTKFRYALFVILSTIPVGITGFLFKDKFCFSCKIQAKTKPIQVKNIVNISKIKSFVNYFLIIF